MNPYFFASYFVNRNYMEYWRLYPLQVNGEFFWWWCINRVWGGIVHHDLSPILDLPINSPWWAPRLWCSLWVKSYANGEEDIQGKLVRVCKWTFSLRPWALRMGDEEINLSYFLLRMTDGSPTFPLFQTSLAWSTKTKIHYLASHQLCETSRNYSQGMQVS
jgi:hypothetical protein